LEVFLSSVYSIGHSNHSIETFLNLLGRHSIQVVCDVRSYPGSRYSPQFNRDAFSRALAHYAGINYLFMGEGLGARVTDPQYQIDGRVSFDAAARRPVFLEALAKVKMLASSRRVCLMCSEKDPADCHRAILVSRRLIGFGCDVQHILATGNLESHPSTMVRLRDQLCIAPTLFSPPGAEFDDVYSAQEEKIAWKVR
jgi:uncharacterized protein (DUF488 family)